MISRILDLVSVPRWQVHIPGTLDDHFLWATEYQNKIIIDCLFAMNSYCPDITITTLEVISTRRSRERRLIKLVVASFD